MVLKTSLPMFGEVTGPPMQATGSPRSDAGVGTGMLRGAGASLTWELANNGRAGTAGGQKLGHFYGK